MTELAGSVLPPPLPEISLLPNDSTVPLDMVTPLLLSTIILPSRRSTVVPPDIAIPVLLPVMIDRLRLIWVPFPCPAMAPPPVSPSAEKLESFTDATDEPCTERPKPFRWKMTLSKIAEILAGGTAD